MAMLVVGLFEARSDAQAALQDLTQSGFDRGDIQVREMPSAQSQEPEADLTNLSRTLQEQGVPSRDTEAYLSGVRVGDTLVYLAASNDRADAARDIMNRHGAIDIYDAHTVRTGAALPLAGAALAASGIAAPTPAAVAPTTPATGAAIPDAVAETDRVAIPIVEEQLAVGKREIQRGGAIIHTHITERPVAETVTLREEHVSVERRPVDRAVTGADTAFREGTLEITETAEEAVVAKNARVVEEVVVGKEATERVETIRDTVRRTDVDVEEIDEPTVTTTSTRRI